MAKYLFRITKTTEAYIEESGFTEIKAMRKAQDRFDKILKGGNKVIAAYYSPKDRPDDGYTVETEIVEVDRDTYEPMY